MTTFSATLDTLNAGTLALLGNCTVAWTSPSAGSTTGLFRNGFTDTFGVAARENSALVQTSAIAALSVDGAITLNGVAYTIRELRPDGDGVTEIVVQAA